MTEKNEFFIEQRDDATYAVRRGGSERASAVAPTQEKAIQKAEKIDPDAAILAARVRHTSEGKPDKWRHIKKETK